MAAKQEGFSPKQDKIFKSIKAATEAAQGWASAHPHPVVKYGSRYAITCLMTEARHGLERVALVKAGKPEPEAKPEKKAKAKKVKAPKVEATPEQAPVEPTPEVKPEPKAKKAKVKKAKADPAPTEVAPEVTPTEQAPVTTEVA